MPKLREQLQDMSFKQKVDHIWEYYKWHILGTILAIILVISFVSSIVGKEETFSITVINGEQGAVNPLIVSQKLNDDISDFNIIVDSIYSGGSFSDMSYEDAQKFMVRSAAGDIELLIIDEKIFEELLMQQDPFAALEGYVALSELELHSESLYYGKSNVIYGINTSTIPAFEQFDLLQDKVLCVFKTVSDKDDVKRFLTAIFNE